MNQKEIQDLIRFVSKSGVTEVEIEEKDFKITIKAESKQTKEEKTVYVQQPVMQQPAPQVQAAAPVQTATPTAPAPAAKSEETKSETSGSDAGYITVKSPMIGTFYRASAPEKPVFVEVGDTVKKGDTVCIIEAMKLFNEIESEVSGKIVKVLVDDASPVEYDQPLFLVDPS
ncbi:MAG: acetyl-CoA carboxylase biotin carboxyl carrier protein [Brumimicrobium sp.]|nr:acetyl-CoA carboxylase biotin carboxyl carrier protein [Brumimicrobium sp.]